MVRSRTLICRFRASWQQYTQIRSFCNSASVASTTLRLINMDHENQNANFSDGVRSDLFIPPGSQLAQGRSRRLVSGAPGPMGPAAKGVAIPRPRRQRIPEARQQLVMVQRASSWSRGQRVPQSPGWRQSDLQPVPELALRQTSVRLVLRRRRRTLKERSVAAVVVERDKISYEGSRAKFLVGEV